MGKDSLRHQRCIIDHYHASCDQNSTICFRYPLCRGRGYRFFPLGSRRLLLIALLQGPPLLVPTVLVAFCLNKRISNSGNSCYNLSTSRQVRLFPTFYDNEIRPSTIIYVRSSTHAAYPRSNHYAPERKGLEEPGRRRAMLPSLFYRTPCAHSTCVHVVV